ncbi:hypothetical protein GCM10009795_005160 [Nocardioides hankookensis]|uniref:DUF3515 family protein n=1 Tax=Nocardioides hankookensis TaxID=443157 RepID=A0ABW1LLH9_9ACTN
MNEHDQLRDLLERAAPERPHLDPGARTDAVVRTGRATQNRSRALLAGLVALLLAVFVVVPLSRGDDASEVAHDTVSPVAPSCPARAIDVTTLPEVPALGGVVAVRSCPATWSGSSLDAGRSPEPLPTSPLLGSVAASFAGVVTGLPAYVLPADCMSVSVIPDPWALQVTTTDDRTYVLGSTMRSCSAVKIDGVDRGVEVILDAFTSSLEGSGDDTGTIETP